MQSVFDNGGMIGDVLDYKTTQQHIVGSTSGLGTPVLVASMADRFGGTANPTTVNFSTSILDNIQEGDLVLLTVGVANTGNDITDQLYPPRANTGEDYTSIVTAASIDSYDCNMFVGYRFMGATPDTSVFFPNGNNNNANALALTIHVWRYIDQTTPLDVAAVFVTQNNNGIPDPPAITPVTNGAIIMACGASGHSGGRDTFSSATLDNFESEGQGDSSDVSVGAGSHAWSTGDGAYDPDQFSWTQGNSGAYSNVSVTLALRPAIVTVNVYGSFKNSGIWSTITPQLYGFNYSAYSYSSDEVSELTPVPLNGVIAGDYIFGFAAHDSTNGSADLLPAGYTQLAVDNNRVANMLFYKIADGTETSIPLLTNRIVGVSVLVVRSITGFTVGTTDPSVEYLDLTEVYTTVNNTANPNGMLFVFMAGWERSTPYTMDYGQYTIDNLVVESATLGNTNNVQDYVGGAVYSDKTFTGSGTQRVPFPSNVGGSDSWCGGSVYVYF